MATVGERRVAAVLGAAVADAAAQPLHWNYKKDKLDALLAGKDEIEFWEPSQNPFYRIATGRHSCYGDQAGVILRSLVQCKGVDVSHLKKEHYRKFGPESEYDNSTINQYRTKEDAGITLPIPSPWRHASIKDFLKNHEAGLEETGSETDGQIDCVSKIAPVVAMFSGHPDLLMKVEEVIRVTQLADTCVSTGIAAARILEHFILHGPDPDAFNTVIKELSNPKRKQPQDLDKAIAGQLRTVIQYSEKPHVTTVREEFVMS